MIVTEENFLLFAAKHYSNVNCSSVQEFEEDLQRFKYLKKLFYTYRNRDVLRERLILNHIVILYNIFEPYRCTEMLVLKLEDYLKELLPFLDVMGYTRSPINIREKDYFINVDKIQRDEFIEKELKRTLRWQEPAY